MGPPLPQLPVARHRLTRRFPPRARLAVVLLAAAVAAALASGPEPIYAQGLRTQSFDADPGWDAVNNRLLPTPCPVTTQSFGLHPNQLVGSVPGAIGGTISNSYRPAFYGRVLARRTLAQPLSASGTMVVQSGAEVWRAGFRDRGRGVAAGGVLLGFFHRTAREWRTPNSLALRLEESDGPGRFAVGVEYGTRTNRAAGHWLAAPGSGRTLVAGRRYAWSLRYDPHAVGGRGRILLSIPGVGATSLLLGPGHRTSGAVFDRFGMLNRMIEGNEMTVFFSDLRVNGLRLVMRSPRGWQGGGNRASFADCLVDNRHNFGWTGAGGPGVPAGAIGGAVWRTEGAQPGLAAHYADRVGPFGLNHELRAAGTLRLVRASSDSAINFGWFSSTRPGLGQGIPPSFVGFNTDGPSAAGILFRPALRSLVGFPRRPFANPSPAIHPNGAAHRWTLHYEPLRSGGGRLTATLDGHRVTLPISRIDRAQGAVLDRFGIRSVAEGGHAQVIYLDELTYSG